MSRSDGAFSSDKAIYAPATGYIPVRVHKEISGSLTATSPSITVRGVGENDWASPRDTSEPLQFTTNLSPPSGLLSDVEGYSGGDRRSRAAQVAGWEIAALALHGANVAAGSGARTYNFIGHSRGAVECVLAAWFLYAYGKPDVPPVPVNIFAIDPVPGPGNWYSIFTQLPPQVSEYVGVYAWDHLDLSYMALVPRPNWRMTPSWAGPRVDPPLPSALQDTDWDDLADECQLADPLKPLAAEQQPQQFGLYVSRGRHATVAGNTTSDGGYDSAKASSTVTPVPELVYKLARGYLTKWGTSFVATSAVADSVVDLRRAIHTDHRDLDAMGQRSITTIGRRASADSGRSPWNYEYLESAVGDPPYRLAYPVSISRAGAGWVSWQFL